MIKYGVRAIPKASMGNKHWAEPNVFVEKTGIERERCTDSDGRFAITDINLAFQYREILADNCGDIYDLGVEEKQ